MKRLHEKPSIYAVPVPISITRVSIIGCKHWNTIEMRTLISLSVVLSYAQKKYETEAQIHREKQFDFF